MGSFRPSLADSISVQENFVSFSALWASAHPRFSFPAGFWQFRLRLRKSLGSFCLLPEISASQPGNSVPFPPGFGNSYLNVKFFFPFLPIFSPLSFRTSTFVLFPVFHKKKFLLFCPCPAFWALPHRNLGDFGQFSAILAPSEQPFPIPASPRTIPSTFAKSGDAAMELKLLFPREWPEGGAAARNSPRSSHPSPSRPVRSLFLVPEFNPRLKICPWEEDLRWDRSGGWIFPKRMEMSPFPCAAGAAGAGKRKNTPLGRRLRGFFREWGCWERRQDPSDSALGTGKAGIG